MKKCYGSNKCWNHVKAKCILAEACEKEADERKRNQQIFAGLGF